MLRISTLFFAAALCFAALPSAHADDRARWPDSLDGRPRVGVQVKIQSFTPDDARQIRQTGFDFVRFGVWTDRLDRPDYRRQLDDAFAAARSTHLPVLLTVRTLAPFGRADGQRDTKTDRASLAAAGARLAGTVTRLAAQYGHALVAVELWNEPDLGRYWPTGDVVHTFPPFAEGLCRGLVARRPDVPVVGFGFARPPLPGSVPDRLLAGVYAAAPACLDAVSYHAYGMTPMQIRDAAHGIRARYGLPALVTEDGAASMGVDGNERQARRLRTLLDARATLGTPLLSIYEWADTANANDAAQRSYGLVRADRSPKPALDAARALLRATASKP
ncbi:beta-xylosidase [Burkholderia sp. AU42008]|uniref:beta-xylosidase n=1 Tax=unclassified Burkholderia TaxID=2613784 RepID=UPI000B7A40AD|nr:MULTISPECIES: beta-xylosidase [unclassified Burkholderia]MBR8234825.1 beta-xylosidase [Burkholderia sp. AU32357]MBY4875762.1 beta-xylosidase [Burkholderia sp. AU42008]OXI39403.1 beta-xylosidase [Burkholderia sp. AU17457]